jgi:hypothetical protein
MSIKKFTTLSIIGAALLLAACDKSPTCSDERVFEAIRNKFQELLKLTDKGKNALEITEARPIRYQENIKTYRCVAYMSGTMSGKVIPKTEIQYSLHILDNDKDFIISFE